MAKLILQLSRNIFFPVFWTLLTLVLLCLPGKAIPGMGLFGIKNLDKIAHFVLFGGFVMLWALHSWQRRRDRSAWITKLGVITFTSIAIGIIMEYVQLNFIANRSFDVWDIWADVVGSVIVMILLARYGRKLNLVV